MTLSQSRQRWVEHFGFTVVPSTDTPTAACSPTSERLLLNLAWAETLSDKEFKMMLHHEWGHRFVARPNELAALLKARLKT